MKKSQFHGINKACVDKFAAPIEKFNTHSDLQNWAKDKRDEIIDKDYPAKQPEGTIQRKIILKEWSEYLTSESKTYTPVMGLMIMSAIIKNLKPNNNSIPPTLNKDVLADTIESVKNLDESNIEKTYLNKLQAFYLMDDFCKKNQTGWILIPSKENDPEHFEENVDKLKMLSHKKWCTKTYNARSYLADGNFHIYLENRIPKLGIRFIGNRVAEIQGEENDGTIPWQYIDELKNYASHKNISLSPVNTKINEAKKIKSKIEELKKKFNPNYTFLDKIAIKAGLKKDYTNPKVIFEEFDMEPEKKSDGTYSISCYIPPKGNFSFRNIGIDEQKLIDSVSEIQTYADFRNTDIKTFNTLKKINGSMRMDNETSKITSLGTLKELGGSLEAAKSNLRDLGDLEHVKGSLDLRNTQITTLKHVKRVDGSARLINLKLKDLGELKRVGHDLFLYDTTVKDKNHQLQYVGGDVILGLNNESSQNTITKDDLKTVEIRGEII